MKQAIVCSLFGKLRDRFCEYGEDLTLTERLERVARIPELAGVEIVYPKDLSALDELTATLARLNLGVAAVNANIKSDPDFVAGALTSPEEAVRRKAVAYIHRAKECASALGAARVTCCPLSDGHDYAFQSHYGAAWDRMTEAIREAALYLPEITLCLEYKPSETRVYNTLSSAARAILLCQAAGVPNLGVNVDIGHSTFGGEPPAEALMLVAASGLPFYVHTNDNNGKWDWDLVAGACNVWEYLEFLFYLKEIGYDGWITSDAVPYRQDPAEIFALNARFTAQLWKWLDEVDRDEIHRHLLRNDFIGLRKILDPHVFSLQPRGVMTPALP
jgi:xylose isomerase